MSASDGVALTLLALPTVAADSDTALLSDSELVRAARFAFERDRSAFITTRAALRRLLGAECAVEPEALELAKDSFGRPYLAGAARTAVPDLDFNVTHSGGRAAIALSRIGRIGIDLESHDRLHSLRELEPMVMGSRERLMLASLSGDEHARAFLGCWTRKEAIVKAIGVGIRYPLPTIDIPTVPQGEAVEFHSEDGQVWSVATVTLDPGVTLSIALSSQRSTSASEALHRAAAMSP